MSYKESFLYSFFPVKHLRQADSLAQPIIKEIYKERIGKMPYRSQAIKLNNSNIKYQINKLRNDYPSLMLSLRLPEAQRQICYILSRYGAHNKPVWIRDNEFKERTGWTMDQLESDFIMLESRGIIKILYKRWDFDESLYKLNIKGDRENEQHY